MFRLQPFSLHSLRLRRDAGECLLVSRCLDDRLLLFLPQRVYGTSIPLGLLGAIALAAALLMLNMPETKGRPLPQTITDGEKLYKTGRKFNTW